MELLEFGIYLEFDFLKRVKLKLLRLEFYN